MLVKHMVSVFYDDLNRSRSEDISAPTWEQIEAAIRGLEKFSRPWITLFLGDQSENPTENCLTVMGGDGLYWMALSNTENDQLRIFDPKRSSNMVEIWTSDQGFQDEEFHTTNDIDLVLRIARYFAGTGGALPEEVWEP